MRKVEIHYERFRRWGDFGCRPLDQSSYFRRNWACGYDPVSTIVFEGETILNLVLTGFDYKFNAIEEENEKIYLAYKVMQVP